MNRKRIIFLVIWLLVFSFAPLTIFLNTPLSLITKNTGTIVNTVQRLFGLWVFSLMFVQIVLGSYMSKWRSMFGEWIFKFHIFEGIFIYSLILVHTFSFVVMRYLLGRGFDPFFVYVDVCALCPKGGEWFYNLGRIAFWFVTIAVFAGYFRSANSFLRKNWRKFHILNYLAFLLAGVHSFFLGQDVGKMPFVLFHGPFIFVVFIIVVAKSYIFIKRFSLISKG